MQDLKIALVQADQHWEAKTANIANYESLLATIDGVDIILLPEMCTTAFTMNAGDLAEDFSNSSSLNWLKKLAESKNSAVFTSLIIQDDGKFRNRGLFVEPNGNVNVYDKRKSFGLAGEDRVFTAGATEKIVSFRGWKIQLQICYDLRFPEIVRNRISNGFAAYDLILYTANWPAKRRHHWNTLLTARAIENQCFVAAVNRIGEDGKGLIYSGDSTVIDPLGETMLHLSSEQVEVIKLTKEKLHSVHGQLPFLKDR
jgi:predicted amidohydrolase